LRGKHADAAKPEKTFVGLEPAQAFLRFRCHRVELWWRYHGCPDRGASLQPKPSLCILERGREWQVGTFPDSTPDVLNATRCTGKPLGLYELLNYQDISIIKGSGLGGTSLINANVAIVPDQQVFERTSWPRLLTHAAMLPYYDRARGVLAATPHPRASELAKVQALERRAVEIEHMPNP